MVSALEHPFLFYDRLLPNNYFQGGLANQSACSPPWGYVLFWSGLSRRHALTRSLSHTSGKATLAVTNLSPRKLRIASTLTLSLDTPCSRAAPGSLTRAWEQRQRLRIKRLLHPNLAFSAVACDINFSRQPRSPRCPSAKEVARSKPPASLKGNQLCPRGIQSSHQETMQAAHAARLRGGKENGYFLLQTFPLHSRPAYLSTTDYQVPLTP